MARPTLVASPCCVLRLRSLFAVRQKCFRKQYFCLPIMRGLGPSRSSRKSINSRRPDRHSSLVVTHRTRAGGGNGGGDDPVAMNSLMPSSISTRLLRSSQSTSGARSILIFC